jgi:hypothetical protein
MSTVSTLGHAHGSTLECAHDLVSGASRASALEFGAEDMVGSRRFLHDHRPNIDDESPARGPR